MLYKYSAINKLGKRVKGQINANNELDLDERLESIGLDLISSSVINENKQTIGNRKISEEELIVFCIHLEQLERAGVPILEAIADLRDTSDSQKMKTLMAEIYESIKSGSMLSEALAEHPRIFSSVFTGLVLAGEKTGNIADSFSRLAEHLKWISLIKSKIKKAIYYPLFLLFLMSSIIALMMLFVIPQLAGFLESQNFDLPIYTKALINFSNFFVSYWDIILISPIIIYLVTSILKKILPSFRYFLDILKINTPILNKIITKIEISRFCHFFAITYKSGIGVLECLDIGVNVVGNMTIQENIKLIRKSVSEGNSLTNAIIASNQFPSLVVRMFKVGEESGNLDMALENVNFFYEREVADSVDNMIGVIQPSLTIFMGGMMLWISLAVFGPLYNSFSQISL